MPRRCARGAQRGGAEVGERVLVLAEGRVGVEGERGGRGRADWAVEGGALGRRGEDVGHGWTAARAQCLDTSQGLRPVVACLPSTMIPRLKVDMRPKSKLQEWGGAGAAGVDVVSQECSSGRTRHGVRLGEVAMGRGRGGARRMAASVVSKEASKVS